MPESVVIDFDSKEFQDAPNTVKSLRVKHGIQGTMIANQIDVSSSHVSFIEKNMPSHLIIKYLYVLYRHGLNLNDLFPDLDMNLMAARVRLGLTRKELSEILQSSAGNIYKLEKEGRLKTKKLVHYLNILRDGGVDLNQIFK